jgi:hypothetical protein
VYIPGMPMITPKNMTTAARPVRPSIVALLPASCW